MKPFHFDAEMDYELVVLFDGWLQLTALLEASTSILEAEGIPVARVKAAVDRGDRALVAILRRDRTEERMS